MYKRSFELGWFSPSFTAHQFVEKGWKDKILNLLQAVDIRIKDIDVDVKDFDLTDLPFDVLSEAARERLKKEMVGKKTYHIKSYHQCSDGKYFPLDLNEESDGSQVVFSIAGPWLDVLRNGYTLVIDELHNSLHPLALRFLVNLFQSSLSPLTFVLLMFQA